MTRKGKGPETKVWTPCMVSSLLRNTPLGCEQYEQILLPAMSFQILIWGIFAQNFWLKVSSTVRLFGHLASTALLRSIHRISMMLR